MARPLEAVRKVGWKSQQGGAGRLAGLVLFHARTGLRPGELLTFSVANAHLNGDNSHILVRSIKPPYDEGMIPLCREARDALRRLSAGRPGRMMHIGASQCHRLESRAGISIGLAHEKCRPYALRRTFAIRLTESGVPDRIVAVLFGHHSLKRMCRYTEVRDPLRYQGLRCSMASRGNGSCGGRVHCGEGAQD